MAQKPWYENEREAVLRLLGMEDNPDISLADLRGMTGYGADVEQAARPRPTEFSDQVVSSLVSDAVSQTRHQLLAFLPPGTRDSWNNLKVGASPGSGFEGMTPGPTVHGNTLVGGGQDGANENKIIGNQMLRSIFGGYKNVIGANLASGIIASQRSEISGTANHANIFGGSLHNITGGAYSCVVGGTSSTANGDFATVIGANTGQATAAGAIVIGGSNSLASGVQAVTIGGGNPKAVGNRSVVLSGQNNEVYSAEAIVGGNTSKVYGLAAFGFGHQALVGTEAQPAWGNYAFLGGGYQNKIGQSATGNYSGVIAGRDHVAEMPYAGIIGGRGAKPRHIGANTHASGYFAAPGDAQTHRLTIRREITDATPAGLYLDNGFLSPTTRLTIADNTAYAFEGRVVARCHSTGEVAAYRIKGAIKRGTGAASTVLVGTPTVEVLGEDEAAWNIAILADATNGALAINAVGEADKTIRWVGTLDLTEVVSA